MDNGFFRVAAVSPHVTLADCEANAGNIISISNELAEKGVELAVFPEMSITGYTCGDLFHDRTLLDSAILAISRIAEASAGFPTAIAVGAPILYNNVLFNCGVLVQGGKVRMIVPKTYLPNYGEFYEKRWWEAAGKTWEGEVTLIEGKLENIPFTSRQLCRINGVSVGLEICEDLWTPVPPSSHLALAGAEVIGNLSASDTVVGKYEYILQLIAQQSARTVSAYVYSSAGEGESSTDMAFDGKAIIAENGSMLAKNRRWQLGNQYVVSDIDIEALRHDRMSKSSFVDCRANEHTIPYGIVEIESKPFGNSEKKLMREIDPLPFVPGGGALDNRCEEVINIQSIALARRLKATGCRKLIVGISGGLDSTLALLVACNTFDRLGYDRGGIVGVTMPGFGTTDRTHDNAVTLMDSLGVTSREISIVPAVIQHFKDIGHDPEVHDVTYENSQARQRTYILMDLANREGGMVLGTGDLSELALGWATYNGDHMSMYGVNAGVPKTLVRHLVRWYAATLPEAKAREALLDVVDTPISPELIPADKEGNITQKTEDLVGPYELHDFFLYHFLRYGRRPGKIFMLAKEAFKEQFAGDVIRHWLKTFFRRFFSQQFKRSCMPDGPKVGSVSLSPRGDWRMPSDAVSRTWLEEIDSI